MSPEPTLKEKTAKGLLWGGVSNGVVQLTGAVFGIILARILDVEDYGLIGMLTIFTSIASAIINSGFTITLTNKKDAAHKDYNAVFWFTFFAGLILYIVLFFAAPLIADFYDRPVLTSLARVLFISFFFGGLGTVSYTIMYKHLMAKQQAQVEITTVLFSSVIGLLLAIKGYAYWALAIQSLSYVVTGSVLRIIICPWKPTFHIDLRPIKEMLPFTTKIFITNIFQQVNNHVFSVILGKRYGETEVGYYSQGYKWMGMGNNVLAGMINSVAQPVLVQINNDKERQLKAFRKMIRFGAFLSMPLMLGLAFVAQEFIQVTIGEKWLPSTPFLQLFCLWGAIGYLWQLYTQLILSHGKSNVFMFGMILIGISQIIVIFALSFLSIITMVIGYIIVYYLGILFWHYYASKLIGIKFTDLLKDILPYVMISLACFAVAWIASTFVEAILFKLIVKITVSFILYIAIMYVSKSVIFRESLQFLKKRGK